VEGLLGAGRAIAWLVEHERDPKAREALSTEGVQVCQWCLRRAPESVECAYRLALALGQQARERPSTANDALPRIVALLEQVVAAEPYLDNSGGDRVLALVLLRAPGWPAGPGDPEAGLEHARQATARVPDHPANWLVLGEALAALGDTSGARDAYRQAEDLAQSGAHAGDPDASEWLDAAARARSELR
jgi:tetratricopeptide (TPR) repeat protein